MYKNIAIICSGEDFTENKIINYCKKSDYIISVDGGLHILDKLSIMPDLILGDMDSVNEEILDKYKNIKQEIYPCDKDYTDSELALKKAISYNPDNIFILSSTGSYFDHSYANVLNLLRNYSKNINLYIITGNSIIFPINKEKVITDSIGKRFSLFPVGKVRGLDLTGSKYVFKNKKNLKPVDYSVSNVIVNDPVVIKLKKGMLVCILFDKGFN